MANYWFNSLFKIVEGMENQSGRDYFRIISSNDEDTGKYAFRLWKAVEIAEQLSEPFIESIPSCIGCNGVNRYSHYHVYVIQLSKEILKERRRAIVRQNPDFDERMPCFYIGYSRHRCECRFNQHLRYAKGDSTYTCDRCYNGRVREKEFRRNGRAGTRGSRYPGEYGERLRPDLFSHLNPIHVKDDALEIEKNLASELRKMGAIVIQN